MNIDEVIRTKLHIANDKDCSIYKINRQENQSKIAEIINNYIDQIPRLHTKEDEVFLKLNGYKIFDNLFSDNEI